MTAPAQPQNATTPSPSLRPSPSTLRRLAIREALSFDAMSPRQPGTAGRRDSAWVAHRYAELLERYGVTDDRVGES